MPPWLETPHPAARPFVATLQHDDASSLGQALSVTLTVAEGVDLDAVGRAFGEQMGGLFRGTWLVPETSPAGRRHIHGVVVGADRGAVLAAWQRCGGGIARAQRLDPIEPGDQAHLSRWVAYSLKRRDLEPGEVIATGVLASPWATATGPRDDDDGPDHPLGTEIDHLDDDVCNPPSDDEPDLPLGVEITHLDDDEPEAPPSDAAGRHSRPWG